MNSTAAAELRFKTIQAFIQFQPILFIIDSKIEPANFLIYSMCNTVFKYCVQRTNSITLFTGSDILRMMYNWSPKQYNPSFNPTINHANNETDIFWKTIC